MTTTLNDIEKEIGLKLNGPIKWKDKISCKNEGIYIVVTPNEETTSLILNEEAIKSWIEKANNMNIGNEQPTYENLKNELNRFWFNNEIVLYVGKAKSIQKRVNQYYRTKIGKEKPHSGGYWIKTLAFLNDCVIYWVECDNSEKIEEQILSFFNNHHLSDKEIPKEPLSLPFANLEIHLHNEKRKIGKNHIIKKARI